MSPRYFGPYKIVACICIGPIAYHLELPMGSEIHDVFHVSLLKKHVGPLPMSNPLPLVSEESTLLLQPESIVDSRIIQKRNYRPKEEVLIKWAGAPVEDATWENKHPFATTILIFILEDKNF
ncbi:hypothetical protein ACOSP7_007646 [Xanthoceras sorbifolium]